MGKRSTFERVERDFYPTPLAAVLPLQPHLPESFTYWEPCAGNGALIGHLMGQCVAATDIEPQRGDIRRGDAMDSATWGNTRKADYIITNPPWSRDVLHPMIRTFSTLRPTWLLFDADWVHTKQSAPFMSYLRKIVSVGRVKWIPDSKMTGKDNAAWYLFDQTGQYTGPTTFHGRTA